MDFIDEEYILVVEIGEYGGEVSSTLNRRSRGNPDFHPRLRGDDIGQGCLAQTGRTVEQKMVQCIPPAFGGSNGYLQILLNPVLSGEVTEMTGSEAGIKRGILSVWFAGYDASYFASPLFGMGYPLWLVSSSLTAGSGVSFSSSSAGKIVS